MKKRRRRYRTIRYFGQLRDFVGANVDRRNDPDYYPSLPPVPVPAAIIVDGNRDKIALSPVKNRWGRTRSISLNTSEKRRRLTLRRLRKKYRQRQKTLTEDATELHAAFRLKR